MLGSDLANTDLQEANLDGASFYRADLCGAYLFNAILRYANLHGADLSETDLAKAIVESTIFGNNRGLTEEDKVDLRFRGATFQNIPGSDVLDPVGK